MINPAINQEIVSLWNEYFSDDPEVYAPLFYSEIQPRQLLFIGMNPSFSPRGFRSFLKNTKYAGVDPAAFFKWSAVSGQLQRIDDLIAIDNYALANYAYFGRPKEISHVTGVGWHHIDLFLYRETNQSNFEARIMPGRELNSFGRAQLDIFRSILEQSNPRCIIVNNAQASRIVRREFADQLQWDESRGFHWLSLQGWRVPIFFSSMLSGQRALDTWSYERLVWHIKQALGVDSANVRNTLNI